MNDERHARVKKVFLEACRRPTDARRKFLEQAAVTTENCSKKSSPFSFTTTEHKRGILHRSRSESDNEMRLHPK